MTDLLADNHGAEIPGAKIPVTEIPSAEIPGAEIPGAEIPGAEIPGAEISFARATTRSWSPGCRFGWPHGLALLGVVLTFAIGTTPADAQPRPQRAHIDVSGIAVAADVDARIQAALALLTRDDRVSEDYVEARELLEEAIAIDPTRAATYYEVARIYRNRINVDESWYYLEQFVSLATDRDHRWYQANALLGARIVDRIYMLGYGPSHLVDAAEAHLLAAYDYARESRSPERMRDLEHELATMARYRGDLEASLRYLRAHVQHFPTSPFGTHDLIAKHLNWLGRNEEALDYIEAVPTNHSDPYYTQREQRFRRAITLAQIHRDIGNTDTALQYLDIVEQDYRFLLDEHEALSSGPAHTRAYARELSTITSERGSVYLETGEGELAVKSFREAHEFQPDEGGKNNLAWAIAVTAETTDTDALEEALSLSRAAVAATPSPAYLDTLAEVLLRLGRYEEALDSIERALDSAPDSNYLRTQRERFERLRDGEALEPGEIHLHRPWLPPEDAAI